MLMFSGSVSVVKKELNQQKSEKSETVSSYYIDVGRSLSLLYGTSLTWLVPILIKRLIERVSYLISSYPCYTSIKGYR